MPRTGYESLLDLRSLLDALEAAASAPTPAARRAQLDGLPQIALRALEDAERKNAQANAQEAQAWRIKTETLGHPLYGKKLEVRQLATQSAKRDNTIVVGGLQDIEILP